MSTPAVTPVATLPSWLGFVVNFGAQLGAVFVANPQVSAFIQLGATLTNTIINQVAAAKAAHASGQGSTASNLVVPIFTDAILSGLATAVAEKRLTPQQATALAKAAQAMLQADTEAKVTEDYSTVALLPQMT